MPAPQRRGAYETVEYVVVERDDSLGVARVGSPEKEAPATTVDRILRRSYMRRQASATTDADDSDDDDDYTSTPKTTRTTSVLPSTTGPQTLRITMTSDESQTSAGALADNEPTETIIVALPPPPPPHHDRDGRISQTTEHLLIAAGSIGATIIIVMVVLALYTMRRRGLTFKDVIQRGKNRVRRPPPPPPSKYGMDNKQPYDDEYSRRAANTSYPSLPAATLSRSGSYSTQKTLQALERSGSFGQRGLERKDSGKTSFYDDSLSRSNSHRRNDSATPSSPVLPIQNVRGSASTRNTRSLDGDASDLVYPDPPTDQRPLPPPPTFRQFLSNRPSMSQRPGPGVGMPSRFSWTNSNAPQTPHDPSRDTVNQPIGRDSFMTSRSSVPRFRTINSWVDQQSTRVETQRLKSQFRMTQSSTASDESDKVPEMPNVPATFSKEGKGLPSKNFRHQRHDTTTTVATATIFKAHPGTEVRFSVRSTVPSEVLDMGHKNGAL